MPKVSIEAKGVLNGIKTISFPADYGFHLKLKCCNCGEESPKPVVVSQEDEVEGIRGATVTVTIKCKLCERTNDLKILKINEYNAEDAPLFKSILDLECRGMEPTELLLADDTPLKIVCESGYEIEEESFLMTADDAKSNEFFGWDEKGNTDVSVEEFVMRVVRSHN